MMNRSMLPEMLQCANPTVLERQRARALQQESFLGDMFAMQTEHGFLDGYSGLNEVLARSSGKIPDAAGFEQGWCDFAKFDMPNGNNMEFACEMSCDISRTSSCPLPAIAEANRKESVEKLSSAPGKELSRKRKSDSVQCGKAVVVINEVNDKKLKGCPEEESSKITEQTSNKSTKNKSKGEASADNSRDNSKTSEAKKPDYIHVRARRGQATDSHSLAERVRREKISERMRYLQDLVPGCNKITGKAGMLDEIINYVQSLQRQVEFLSMKLATVNPKIDFNIDNLLAKGLFPPCPPSFLLMGMSTEIPNSFPNPLPTSSYLQFNPVQEAFSCCGVEMGVNPSDMGLKRTISAPVSAPDTFLCPSSLPPAHPNINWDADFQSLNNMELQARLSAFTSLGFTGGIEASNIKMEN